MVKVERVYVVDGMDTGISYEAGSAKEALAFITAAAEELGAAPRSGAVRVTAGGEAPGTGRVRRTKEQIAADEAAAKAKAQMPPNLPPGVQHAFPGPHTGAAANNPQFFQDTTTSAPFSPPPAQLRHDIPPVSQQGGVSVSGPPAPSFAPPAPFAPPPGPDQQARSEARAVVDHLMGSIPDAWKESIRATVHGFIDKHGGVPIEMMIEAHARAFTAEVKAFQTVCDNAPR